MAWREIGWRGIDPEALAAELEAGTDFESLFARAPRMNPARGAITGTVCGVRVEEVEEPLVRDIRYLDEQIDELAPGKRMERILREGSGQLWIRKPVLRRHPVYWVCSRNALLVCGNAEGRR